MREPLVSAVPSLLFALVTAAGPTNAQWGAQTPVQDGLSAQEICPDYTNYATYPHRPLSTGSFPLPFQRPHVRCRTYTSESVERVIEDITGRMKNPDLARLFENAYPNTLDTTIKFHNIGSKKPRAGLGTAEYGGGSRRVKDGSWEGLQAFVITGDIIAEWLRDSTNQLKPYLPLVKHDKALFDLVLGAINTQSEYVYQSPYCNAFQPPPISTLAPTLNGQDDAVHPAVEPTAVFECKYELDSLAHFLALANDFHAATGSTKFMTARWYQALDMVLHVLSQQSRGTFDEKGRYRRNEYTFQRWTNTGTETLSLLGHGNPMADGTGLVRSAFRPSDDATILPFLIPANAQMAVQLRRTAKMLRKSGEEDDELVADTLEQYSKNITAGIWEHAVVEHKKYGRVFAYEVDGYGSTIMMDDANYPSLLALPLMGFLDAENIVYQNTRRMLLDKKSNPYYLTGRQFKGIGGPHIGLSNAWPMSLLVQAQTSDDDDEIWECVELVLNSSRLGLVHESVDVNSIHAYTRSWFAWANGVFADTILDIAKRKPHLIFKDEQPYDLSKA